ncbi:uncharacterized protein [Antedon mediterranea]|uniref:uncharacterized protein n=1 Tax=Antedon mediterranea TaxID=105859 RepID=UPI003AF7523D
MSLVRKILGVPTTQLARATRQTQKPAIKFKGEQVAEKSATHRDRRCFPKTWKGFPNVYIFNNGWNWKKYFDPKFYEEILAANKHWPKPYENKDDIEAYDLGEYSTSWLGL